MLSTGWWLFLIHQSAPRANTSCSVAVSIIPQFPALVNTRAVIFVKRNDRRTFVNGDRSSCSKSDKKWIHALYHSFPPFVKWLFLFIGASCAVLEKAFLLPAKTGRLFF